MKRRLISLLLILALVLSVCPISALGLMPDVVLRTEQIPFQVNPLYADVLEADDFELPERKPTFSTHSSGSYLPEAEAAEQIRGYLKSRTEVFTVCLQTSNSDIKAATRSAFYAALEHNGNPVEGDYLRWQYGGYRASMGYYTSGGISYVEITYTVPYYTTPEQEAELDAAVALLMDDPALEHGDDYDKIRFLYDYICRNVTYDYDNLYDDSYKLKYTAYAAMIQGTAVCQGYALLLYRLALTAGVDARLISGLGNGGAHGWNIVEMDGLYYNMDSTWDAPRMEAGMEYAYFLVSDDNFGGHIRDEEYASESFYAAYPMGDENYIHTETEEPTNVASGKCGDNATWTWMSDGALCIQGSGNMWNYDGSMYVPWADYTDQITSVTIEEGITSIGDYAFDWLLNVNTIDIPNTVTTIGDWAFGLTGLTSVVIPADVTRIGAKAFAHCAQLEEIRFAGDAPSIGEDAMYEVTATIYYPNYNFTWSDDVLLNYGGTLTWSPYYDGIPVVASGTCGDNLIWTLDEEGKLTITGTGAMYEYSSENHAPWYDNQDSILSVSVDHRVTHIGDWAFVGCRKMTSIDLPDGLTSIGEAALAHCSSLTQIEIPDGVTAIADHVFYGCSGLESIELPDGATSIGYKSFMECSSLTSIDLPDGITSMDDCAFWKCTGLTDVDLPDELVSVGEWVFCECTDLTSIVIPDGVTSIGYRAFAMCSSLNSVELPDGLASIEDSAFIDCTGLTFIRVPAGVRSIGGYAFGNCKSLKEITFEGNPPEMDGDAFRSVTATAYYPADNTTWTEELLQPYGGTLTWMSYVPFGIIGEGTGDVVKAGEDLTIHIHADHTKLVAVYMDGELVDPANYTVTQGSTIITLKAEYLATLGTGEHEVSVVFQDGSATATITVPDYLPGDITGDGKVNNRDAARLMQYLAGWDVEFVEEALDVNGDGKINNRDAARLMQHLAGWDVDIH